MKEYWCSLQFISICNFMYFIFEKGMIWSVYKKGRNLFIGFNRGFFYLVCIEEKNIRCNSYLHIGTHT